MSVTLTVSAYAKDFFLFEFSQWLNLMPVDFPYQTPAFLNN